jgi:hypothetical protein
MSLPVADAADFKHFVLTCFSNLLSVGLLAFDTYGVAQFREAYPRRRNGPRSGFEPGAEPSEGIRLFGNCDAIAVIHGQGTVRG